MQFSKTLWVAFSCLYALTAIAQEGGPGTYQELSKIYYAKQKDSLKKAWICPTIFKEKETQKKYKEIWDSRTEFLTQSLETNDYVYDKEVFNYIYGIINQLAEANKDKLPVKPFLLLDRSSSVNAYAIGNNVIAVNLGLVSFARSKEELALILAHELSHNILLHAENAMKQRAELLTSESYKNSLNAVLDSKYERYSRLKKVLENYSFSRSKHQRYHEGDADSLAILLLKQANITFDATYFLRLDSADMQYRRPLKADLKTYFTAYNLAFEESWSQKRSRGLSTRNYSFNRDSSTIQDSLKTHPDCVERYTKTRSQTDAKPTFTAIPALIRDRATKLMLWNLYNNMSLTPCLYRILQEKDNGNKDEWYDFMIYNIFSGLHYADRELRRFNAIGVVPKEYVSKSYFELQTTLEQIPRESLVQYCKSFQTAGFWNAVTTTERSFKKLMYTLALDEDNSDKNKALAAKAFTDSNPNSLYCEFAKIFEKK